MAYKAVWNFGTVKIKRLTSDDLIEFDIGEGNGILKFTETVVSLTTNSGRNLKKSLGFRAIINIDLTNICDGTADKITELFKQYNEARSSDYAIAQGHDEPFRIYPRFDDDLSLDENYYYDCHLTSDISMLDLAPVNVGQSHALSFESIGLNPLLTTSTPEFTVWEVKIGGTLETLQFNDDGDLVDAKFKIN
jgi:hypothetical protein